MKKSPYIPFTPPEGSHRVRNILLATVASLTFLLGGGAIGGYLWIDGKIKKAKEATPSGMDLYLTLQDRSAQSTSLLDAHGEVLGKIGGKTEDDVALQEMNPALVAALVAVEDKRFREHSGVDRRGMFGLIKENLFGHRRGGSTIASQLFKKKGTYENQQAVSDAQRFDQKVEERVKANKLITEGTTEMKRFVLEYYLNNTYFVADRPGVQAAAKILFGKDQSKLEIDEAAMIVGLAKNPTKLNPISQKSEYRQAAERRTDEVLKDLALAIHAGVFDDVFRAKFGKYILQEGSVRGYISLNTLAKVQKTYTKHSTRENLIPHATADLASRADAGVLQSLVGEEAALEALKPGQGRYLGVVKKRPDGKLDTLRVREGGFVIHTTLEKSLQAGFTQLLDHHLNTLDKQRAHPDYPLQGAILCIDNATGKILADIRGRDFRRSELDFRAASTEQGSVIKGLVDAVALEMGFIPSLEEQYVDTAITLTPEQYSGLTDSEGWTPKNFTGTYSGDTLTVGKGSLIDSRNTAIAFLCKKAADQGRGSEFITKIFAKLDQLHVPYPKPDHFRDNPQVGIGLVQGNLDLIAKMYLAIGTGGKIPERFTDILSVEDLQGGLLYTAEPGSVSRNTVYTPEVCAALQPYLLEKGRAVTHGKYTNVLAKSGTTGEANKLWMVVVTPGVTLVVRVGPEAYTDSNGQILGRPDKVNATNKLSPLVIQCLELLHAQGKYDPKQRFPGEKVPVESTLGE